MDSALTLGSSFYNLKPIPSLSPLNTLKPTAGHPSHSSPFPISKPSSSKPHIRMVKASSDPISHGSKPSFHIPIIHKIKTSARAIVFVATAFSIIGKFQQLPARADPPPPITEEIQETLQEKTPDEDASLASSEFIESNSEAIETLKTLLQQKLEVGDAEESLKILKKLMIYAQPENNEWKFLMARLLIEMGEIEEARKAFEEILAKNPLSFEALFENALLVDNSGEGEKAIKRLEEALEIAVQEKKMKEARHVRLIMAHIQFLQKNVEEALKKYEELEKEDPNDFRPYFCKGMIFTLLEREREAAEQFAKYRELSPKKFEVEGYLKTPLSRMKLCGNTVEN